MTDTEIFDKVSATMAEMFQLDPGSIKMEARLVEDLDLDSIDAIDMAVKIQELTGKRVEEDQLREIHTVADVVRVIESMLETRAERSG